MMNEFCALYIVKDTLSGDIKIGISNNPKARKLEIENQYNVGEVIGLSITWFFTREEALNWEHLFHQKYQHKHSPERGGKEWFTLTEDEIKEFTFWMKESNKQNKEKLEKLKNLLDK